MPAYHCDTEHSSSSGFITKWKILLWSVLSYLKLSGFGFFPFPLVLLPYYKENQFIWGSVFSVCNVFPPPCSRASIISDLHVYCFEANLLSCSFTRHFLSEGLSFSHFENVISAPAFPTDELQAAAANSTASSFAVHTQTQQRRDESSISFRCLFILQK